MNRQVLGGKRIRHALTLASAILCGVFFFGRQYGAKPLVALDKSLMFPGLATCVEISPDSTMLAAVSNRALRVIAVDTGREVVVRNAEAGEAFGPAIAWLKDSHAIIFGIDQKLMVQNISGTSFAVGDTQHHIITDIQFITDAKVAVAGERAGDFGLFSPVEIWLVTFSAHEGEQVCEISTRTSDARCAASAGLNEILLAVGFGDGVEVFQGTESNICDVSAAQKIDDVADRIVLTPDGDRLLLKCKNEVACWLRSTDGKFAVSWRRPYDRSGRRYPIAGRSYHSVASSYDGNVIVNGLRDGCSIIDGHGKLIGNVGGQTGAVCVSRDGGNVVVAQRNSINVYAVEGRGSR